VQKPERRVGCGIEVAEQFCSEENITAHLGKAGDIVNKTAKVALVTGGNRGIGLETARALGKTGVTVVIGARSAKAGEEAVTLLRQEGITVEVIEYDARKPETDGAGVVPFLSVPRAAA
jgi:hypothetical protein